MRIIGGKYRSKVLKVPANFKARPTTDFAKEGLFNILNNYFDFENIDILDLFAGTGGVSYEFLSRDVKSLIAVDSNFTHCNFIGDQFEEMGFKQAKVVKSDVFRYLKSCKKKFDVIFADPPYDLLNIHEIYDDVIRLELLTDTSLLIIEHSNKTNFSKHKYFVEMKKYGSVHFSIFDLDA